MAPKEKNPDLEDTSRPFVEVEREHVRRFNEHLRERQERERLGRQKYDWSGNQLPPMRIEPMVQRRDRLHERMSEEDRMLRRQWVADQKLAPGEPRFVPEMYPKHAIRRAISWPWDKVALAIRPVVGLNAAKYFRRFVPKGFAGYLVLCWGYYHLKYKGAMWESVDGWKIYTNSVVELPGDVPSEIPDKTFFADLGFKARKSHLDTSPYVRSDS